MSLFLRIWLMVTVVMTLAVLAGLAAYKAGVDRDTQREQRADALATVQLVAQAVGAAGRPDDVAAQVRSLMHTGQFLALAAFDADGARLVSATLPGLESLDLGQHFTPAALSAVARGLVPVLNAEPDALHVAQPVFDASGEPRGTVALSLPRHVASLGTQDRVVFAVVSLAAVLALAFAASAMLARRISGPINAMSSVADGLEDGRLDTGKVSALIGRHDEIGKLARTVLRLTRALDHVSTRMDMLVEARVAELTGKDVEPAKGFEPSS